MTAPEHPEKEIRDEQAHLLREIGLTMSCNTLNTFSELLPAQDAEQDPTLTEPRYLRFRFRDQEVPVRLAETLDADTYAAISHLCEHGLQDLMAKYGDYRSLGYAGYALVMCSPPASAENADQTAANHQDFHIRENNCFDWREVRDALGLPGERSLREYEMRNRGYILLPVVRFEPYLPKDVYAQPMSIIPSMDDAVYIPGGVLFEDMRRAVPKRANDGFGRTYGASVSEIHEHLTERFGLQPANEQFRTEWMREIQRRQAEQAEQDGGATMPNGF